MNSQDTFKAIASEWYAKQSPPQWRESHADRMLRHLVARQVGDYWLPTADVQQRNIIEGLKKRLSPCRGNSFAAIVEPKLFG